MTDPEADELGRLFRGLANKGAAVMLIEHNTRLISAVSDFVYVLNQGKVIADGTAQAVMSLPDVIEAYLGRRK